MSARPMLDIIFVGKIVHSLSLNELEILDPGMLGVGENGKLVFLIPIRCKEGERVEDLVGSTLESMNADKSRVRYLPPHTLLIPGLIDTHVHAPQYTYTGTGYTLPLLEWLSKFTFPREKKFASTAHAEKIYPRTVARSLRCGTTTAAWYGTIHVPATVILAETCARLGQRAFVGKVCMDRNGGEGYVESSAMESLRDTEGFVESVQKLGLKNVEPILTPRFAVSCTSELLGGLGRLAKKHSLPIQTHCAENPAECRFVSSLFPSSESYVDVYRIHDLLTPRTVLAHCVYLSEDDRKMLRDSGAGVSHCPVSNFAIESGVCDVRKLLDSGCKVGLGTDVAGGWSMSLIEAMRSAIVASKVVAVQKRSDPVAEANGNTDSRDALVAEASCANGSPQPYRPLTLPEAFYLATLGGASILGIHDVVGNFVPGKEFDAIIVDLDAGVDATTATDDIWASRSIDIFEDDDTATMFEKFIFLGDDRHIREVYVGGKRVVPAL